METNILIVDDDENIQMLVAEYLESWGYNTFLASGVDQALEQLKLNEFQVIITDKNMPCPDDQKPGGIYLTEVVRKLYPSAEVIILTGFASMESAIEAIKAGAFDYIVKPMKPDELKEKIDRIIEYKKLINPLNAIPIYKNIYGAVLKIFKEENKAASEKQKELLELVEEKIDHFFIRQKQAEHLIIIQHEALSRIAGYAEELNELLKDDIAAGKLLKSIMEEASKRL